MKDGVKKILRFALLLAVAAAFLFWAFSRVNAGEFIDSLQQTRWSMLALSLLAGCGAIVLRMERWRLLLLPLDGGIKRRNIWHGYNIGNFLSALLPGTGEFARCGFVSTGKASYERVLGTEIVERTLDVAAVAVLFLTALFAGRERLEPFVRENVAEPIRARFNVSFGLMAVCCAVALAVFCVVIYLFRRRSRLCSKCVKVAGGILNGAAGIVRMRGRLLFLAYTVGIWLMYVLMTYLVFLAVPSLNGLSFGDAVFVSAIGNLASVVPTPGNLGPYHWLVGTALSSLYFNSAVMVPDGLVFATLSHGIHFILVVVLGVYSYFCMFFRGKKTEF